MPETLSQHRSTPLAAAVARRGRPGAAARRTGMSLRTLSWLGAALGAVVVFIGSALICLSVAGGEIERQLQARDRDAAMLLAHLAAGAEPTRDALAPLIQQLFDGGQYTLLRIERDNGEILAQRVADEAASVPYWFSAVRPLAIAPASIDLPAHAALSGTVTVLGTRSPAHEALWNTLYGLMLWFALAALTTGVLTAWLIRRLLAPLDALTDQVRAFADLRFPRLDTPATPELRPLAAAINALGERLETEQAEQHARIGQLDHLAGHDELTGLPNRSRFLAMLDTTLDLAAANPDLRGSMAVLRVANLDGLNRSFGRSATDKLLVDVAARLRAIASARPGRTTARLNGRDFALIAPDVERPSALANELSSALAPLENLHGEGLMKRLPIGVVGYAGGEPRERLLARLDSALASAEYARRGSAHIGDPETVMPARTDLAGWREALEQALDAGHLRIDAFPVLDAYGNLLHFEAPSRILIDDLWYSAVAFLAWAERLGMTPRIDLAALRLALERIEARGQPVGINVSASSLRDAHFLEAFHAALKAHPEAAASLWIELPEQGVVADLAAFRALCAIARPFGCRLGLEHAGREFGQLGGLHDLGLNYVKIDAGLVRNVASNQDKHGFLVRICELARAIGLLVIAEGVDHLDDLEAIRLLEFDGMTGSVVRLPENPDHD